MSRSRDDYGGEIPTSSRRLARACGARVTGGRYCKRAAGSGTDHPGVGLCSRHGGNSDQSLKRAGMVLAHEGIMNPDIHPGDVVEIEPHNALLWATMIAGGDVSYWQQDLAERGAELAQIEALLEAEEDEDEIKLLEAQLKEARKELKASFSQQRTASREMRQAGKMAIDAGLSERQVLLAERMAGLFAAFAQELVGELDLKPRDLARLPDIVQSIILRMEAPDTQHAAKPKLALTAHKKGEIFIIDEDEADAA